MIDLTLKEMAFILEIMDRTQLQGIDAKQTQIDVMRKMATALEAPQGKENDERLPAA